MAYPNKDRFLFYLKETTTNEKDDLEMTKVYTYENIKVGETYKSYRHLCEVLNADVLGGNAKKSQIKDWECRFAYAKQGNKFIVTEIYNEPVKREDYRAGGNNKVKYIDEIEKLIIDLLLTKGKGENRNLFLSRGKLLKELNMINGQYSYNKQHKNRLSKKTKISIDEIEDFYTSSDSLFQRNLESALNSLRNKAIIIWHTAITVIYVNTNAEVNHINDLRVKKREVLDEFGDVDIVFENQTITNEKLFKKANEYEEEVILEAEGLFLDKYKSKSIQEVIFKGHAKDFYKDVKEYLFYNYNILGYYSSFEITFNKSRAEMEQKELEELTLKENDKQNALVKLNNDVVKQLENNTANRHEKAERKYNETKKSKYKMRMDASYISNGKVLIDTLITPPKP